MDVVLEFRVRGLESLPSRPLTALFAPVSRHLLPAYPPNYCRYLGPCAVQSIFVIRAPFHPPPHPIPSHPPLRTWALPFLCHSHSSSQDVGSVWPAFSSSSCNVAPLSFCVSSCLLAFFDRGRATPLQQDLGSETKGNLPAFCDLGTEKRQHVP